MNEAVVRRKCEAGEYEFAEKVGSRWFINFDRTLGRAAPMRSQPVDMDELAGLIASKLLQALDNGLPGTSATTRFYHT